MEEMTGRTEHTVVGIASRRTLHAAHEVVAKLGERHTAVDDRAAVERLLVLAKGGVGDEALVVEHDPAPPICFERHHIRRPRPMAARKNR